MILRALKYTLLLFIFSIPIVRPFDLYVAGMRANSADLIFLLLIALAILAAAFGKVSLELGKFHFFIGLYVLTLTISAVFSEAPARSVAKLAAEFYLCAVALIVYHAQAADRRFAEHAGWAWLAGTGVTFAASAAGVLLFYCGRKTQTDNFFLSHFGSLPSGNYPRVHALFANANMMANYLNVSLMFAFVTGNRVVRRLALGAIAFAAFFTLSPGLGGLFLSAGLWLGAWENSPRRRRPLALCGGAIAVAALAATLVSPDTPNTTREVRIPFSNAVVEPSVRVLVWEDALRTFASHPVFGRGIGVDPARVEYVTLSNDRQVLLDAHNVWLSIAGQCGIVGLVGLFALTIFLWKNCGFEVDETDELSSMHVALSCAFVGAFLFQGLMGSFEDARHLWVLFGLLSAVSAESAAAKASRVPSPRPAT